VNDKKKAWMVGGLATMSVGIWAPQLFRGAESPPPGEDLPASAATSPDGAGEAARTDSGAGDPEPSGGIEDTASDSLTRLESSLARFESLFPGSSGSPPTTLPDEDSGEPLPAALPSAQEALHDLEAFAATNPLSGLIRGSDRSLALLGHRVVALGDRLEGGRIVVREIGPGWVSIEEAGEVLRIDLGAFVAEEGASTGSAGAGVAVEGGARP